MSHTIIRPDHPANAQVLNSFSGGKHLPSRDVHEYAHVPTDFYPMNLGIHPDLVEHLWVTLTRGLPTSCAYLVYGAPVLVHPNGIVFANVRGTFECLMRFPQTLRESFLQSKLASLEYQYPNVTHYAKNWGDDWVFLEQQFDAQAPEWTRQAYDYAGTLADIDHTKRKAKQKKRKLIG